MKIAACLSSNNAHYCTPPMIARPVNRLLVPKSSGRELIDLATNDAAIRAGLIRATFTCDGLPDGGDGLTVDASVADAFWCNPEYGGKVIVDFANRLCELGRDRGMPGLALLPNRSARWMLGDGTTKYRGIKRTADAWLEVDRRIGFWRPLPLDRLDGDYYLRHWFSWAEADNLPAPFRSIGDGWAIGPELAVSALGKDVTAPFQSAPFDSLIAFWGDQHDADRPPVVHDETRGQRIYVDQRTDGQWVLVSDADGSSTEVSERFANDWIHEFGKPAKVEGHPITVREFVRHFGHLGTITIARGPHRGVYHRRVA